MKILPEIIFLIILFGLVQCKVNAKKKFKAGRKTSFVPWVRSDGIILPRCSKRGANVVLCCLSFNLFKNSKTICVSIFPSGSTGSFRIKTMFEEKELVERVLKNEYFCAQIPHLPKMFTLCSSIYYIKFYRRPVIAVEFCLVATLANYFDFKFYCIKVDKRGKFEQHYRIEPDNQKGIFTLKYVEGNVTFTMNQPFSVKIIGSLFSKKKTIQQMLPLLPHAPDILRKSSHL